MAKKRQTIEIEGMGHNAPIPLGVKIGNMVFTGAIMGTDPKTGKLPPDAEEQARLVFQHMRTIMEKAGGTVDDIAHVTVFVKEEPYRQYVNKEWMAMFPNEDDRPSRHAVVDDLRGGMLVQCEMTAVLS